MAIYDPTDDDRLDGRMDARELIQRASNLIADDLVDCDESNAPEHFAFLRDAAKWLGE